MGGLEDLLAVAGVGGVEVDARLDDLVDAVEDRCVERDVGGGELAVELLHCAWSDDCRGHGRVVDDEPDRELDERYTGVVGDLANCSTASSLRWFSGSDMSKRATSRWRAGEVGELSALQLPDSQPPASGL